MAWWMIPLATAALGGLQAEKQRKEQVKQNKLEAELTKYAPWTGQWGDIKPVGGGFLEGAIQGGAGGVGLSADMMNAGFIEAPYKAEKVPTAEVKIAQGWDILGDSPQYGVNYKAGRYGNIS